MANTYSIISSTTVSSPVASITFSAIPASYDDILIQASIRTNRAGNNLDTLYLQVNGNTSSVYSQTTWYGTGSAIATLRTSNQTTFDYDFVNGDASLSNTFANYEIYIPSYRVARNKPMATFTAQEDNLTSARMNRNSFLFRSTSAITSLQITSAFSSNFVAGSSFYLYGIKNS